MRVTLGLKPFSIDTDRVGHGEQLGHAIGQHVPHDHPFNAVLRFVDVNAHSGHQGPKLSLVALTQTANFQNA